MRDETNDTIVDPPRFSTDAPGMDPTFVSPKEEVPLRPAGRYKAAVFALLTVAGAVTFFAAVRFWLPPWAPLAVFVVFGVAPLTFWAFVGALVFDPSKPKDGIVAPGSPALAVRLKLAMTPVAVAAVAGGLLASLWFFAPIRGLAVDLGISQRLHATLESALFDESAEVRLSACQGLATIKADGSHQLVMSLGDSDDAVVGCALEALPSQDVAPPHLGAVATRWQTELMEMTDAPEGGERACELSNRLRIAERKGLKQASMNLLTCALDAQGAPARECCAQSFRAVLGASDVEVPMVMGPPNDLIQAGFFKSVPSLLEAAYSSRPELEKTRAALRLDTPRTRAWAMALGCETLLIGGADLRAPMSAAMAQAVSSDSCRLEPARETTVRLWLAVCSEIYSPQGVASATGEESGKFCSAISDTLMVDASNEARKLVQDAHRTARQPGRRAEVMRALLDYGTDVARATVKGGPQAGASTFFEQSPLRPAPQGDGKGGGASPGLLMEMMKIMNGEGAAEGEGEDPPEVLLEKYMREQAEIEMQQRGKGQGAKKK